MAETRSSIQNLEIQIGQLRKKLLEEPSNTLPSNTEINPRKKCKVLTLEAEAEPKEKIAVEELKENKDQEEIRSALTDTTMKMKEPKDQPTLDVHKEPEDEQLTQFLVALKKLQVKISFAEVLEKKPPYMACLKSVISEKTALKGNKTMVLTKECSALVQKKLPHKMPDPGSFLISCTIGTITFEKALCDLGSSINLMPLSVTKKLGIQEVQPTRFSLEMADKSLKWAYGLVENVLVKVEDLYLPADFVILDTKEDQNDSIILGRPFLATGKALIDVEKGELILRLWEDHILFKIPNLRYLSDKRVDRPITGKGIEYARELGQAPPQELIPPPQQEQPEIPQGYHFPPHKYCDKLAVSIGQLASSIVQMRIEHKDHLVLLHQLVKE
ncbi:uncharacterized protein LOC107493672 [Arachis duranensis]|uniref:Uncharacterized protein LOC107493672 n=1 Tax=Arachis duranensis TaxID=130453 RepID=A0A6P4DLC6_ARADU|nr:uncharacterized protein LOC107493672 [Arachis duranensis]